MNHQDIRIGTIAPIDKGPEYIAAILPHGFESFQLTTWQVFPEIDLKEYAKKILDTIGEKAIINCLGVYGNPLTNPDCAKAWQTAIMNCGAFGAKVVCGFAGALEDRPVDQSIPKFKEVFGELAKVAADQGIKLGFENCDMGGTWEQPKWNIAHAPRAWEMMFDAVPGDTLGLEWEPCHQMVSLIDPIAQLREWAPKVVHLHGKDATVAWDVIRKQGIRSGVQAIWHRTPGFGDSNWTDIITILRQNKFSGAIDIEGWHDPIYRDELEMTGQVHALNYLKSCRGGAFVANP